MKKAMAAVLVAILSLTIIAACEKKYKEELVNIENVYIVPNTENFLRDEVPTKTENGGLTAFLAKNESEGMQFLLRFDRDVKNVKVSVSDILNESGDKLDFTLYRQRYIEVNEERFPTETGFYPDALIPMFDGSDGKEANDTCNIDAGKNQGYWITVRSAQTQAAGKYTGKVSVTFDGGEREIPVSVEVWDFALPVKSSMQTNFLHHWNNNYYEDVGISS